MPGPAGIPVLLDGGSYKPGTEDLLADVDLAILSADFAAPGHDDPLAWVRQQGCRRAARSAGAGPVLLSEGTCTHSIAVPRVDVVDTLGAGDVLHGAAAYAVACRGLADVPAVLRFAVDVASLSCRYAGALGWAADDAARAIAHGPVHSLRPPVCGQRRLRPGRHRTGWVVAPGRPGAGVERRVHPECRQGQDGMRRATLRTRSRS